MLWVLCNIGRLIRLAVIAQNRFVHQGLAFQNISGRAKESCGGELVDNVLRCFSSRREGGDGGRGGQVFLSLGNLPSLAHV